MKIPDYIKQDISLKQYNWYELGGNAKYFAEVTNLNNFLSIMDFKDKFNLPIKILGLGANVLISDEGYNGIIVKLFNKNISHAYIDDNYGILKADAGCTIEQLINYSLNEALLFGLEEFSGIPSTVGGALFINLHYFSFLISQFILNAEIYDINNNTTMTVNNNWFEFGYDTSKVKNNKQYIILSATFLLKRNNNIYAEYAKGRSIEIIRHRKSRYPYQKTCGCFFKNVSTDIAISNHEGKKILAASYYLDKVGARDETKINNCWVSSQHANMFIHNGYGTSTDIIKLAKILQEKVYKKYNILLEPECELIGFSEYPFKEMQYIK